jgi:hypothetical protein
MLFCRFGEWILGEWATAGAGGACLVLHLGCAISNAYFWNRGSGPDPFSQGDREITTEQIHTKSGVHVERASIPRSCFRQLSDQGFVNKERQISRRQPGQPSPTDKLNHCLFNRYDLTLAACLLHD